MIYRNYPKSPGPACLNWELTNIVEEAGLEGTDEEAAMRATLRWVGLETDVDELSIAAVRRGLPPSATIAETARARALLPESKELAPIVTIDDPRDAARRRRRARRRCARDQLLQLPGQLGRTAQGGDDAMNDWSDKRRKGERFVGKPIQPAGGSVEGGRHGGGRSCSAGPISPGRPRDSADRRAGEMEDHHPLQLGRERAIRAQALVSASRRPMARKCVSIATASSAPAGRAGGYSPRGPWKRNRTNSTRHQGSHGSSRSPGSGRRPWPGGKNQTVRFRPPPWSQ